MQSVSSRIWTRVAVSISYDDNDYTTGTSSDYGGEKNSLYQAKMMQPQGGHLCLFFLDWKRRCMIIENEIWSSEIFAFKVKRIVHFVLTDSHVLHSILSYLSIYLSIYRQFVPIYLSISSYSSIYLSIWNDFPAFKIKSSDILFHSSLIAVLSEPIFRPEVAFVLFSKTPHIP